MCDCCGGDFGGAEFPMSTPFNTLGVGEVVPATMFGLGSGDRFGGTAHRKRTKKNADNSTRTYNDFVGTGISSTSGSYDMSPRPLFVPIKK